VVGRCGVGGDGELAADTNRDIAQRNSLLNLTGEDESSTVMQGENYNIRNKLVIGIFRQSAGHPPIRDLHVEGKFPHW